MQTKRSRREYQMHVHARLPEVFLLIVCRQRITLSHSLFAEFFLARFGLNLNFDDTATEEG